MHKTGVMYEEDVPLIENIHIWFATMTSCFSRPFRHTATVVSLSVASTLCAMVTHEVNIAAQVRRQIEGEKKKKGANKARLADYQQKVEASETKQQFLKGKIDDFFETVYVHRYRDVDPKIRTECVEAMGDWIKALPSVFLEGAYLRYLGWMLSDTHPPVRHAVIRQLTKIMEVEANIGTMRHFIERFRPRMIEMATQDSDSDIRASAVHLANLIREAGLLEPNDIDAIGRLIFDSELRVRKAVVDFFVASMNDLYDNKVEELGGEEDLEEVLLADKEDYDNPRREWIKLKTLAEILAAYDAEDSDEMPSQIQTRNDSEFLNMSGTESRFTHAAQALYDKVDELKEWDVLSGYLLFDHSSKPRGNKTERALKEAIKPTEGEENILLEILDAVVKLALSAQGDEAEKPKDRSKKANTKAELAEKREGTARRLAALIPRLLKKYGANPKTVTVVLRLEHVLDLEIFQELRQSTAFSKYLDEISMLFNSHADKGVLTEAGAALLHAKSYGDLEEVTDNKMQSLWEDTISTLRRINKAGEIAIRGSFRDSILTELSHNLARLDQLAGISNCVEPLESESDSNDPLPINILLDVVARGNFEEPDPDLDELEDDVVVAAIHSSMFYFMWKVHGFTESVSAGEKILDVDIDNLRELEETFISNLITALSSRATLDPVRLFATGTLLDLHVLFSTLRTAKKPKAKNGVSAEAAAEPNEHLHSLVKEIAPEVQQELTGIFDQAEKQFAKKGKKKLAEPVDDEGPEDLESEPEDEEDDENERDIERRAETLKAEQHLCELTGKLVLAIIAKVIDASGPLAGKLRSRIQRNKDKLGPNFKKVVEYLDERKSKDKKKSHSSKAEQVAPAAKKTAKSTEVVEEEDEDDPFAEPDAEEGDEEDMRRRELLDEGAPASVAEEVEVDEDEDDVMAD
jgi:cohesin complex subunit SA-1/2